MESKTALIISCYVLTLFFIHTASTCIVRLGDICNAVTNIYFWFQICISLLQTFLFILFRNVSFSFNMNPWVMNVYNFCVGEKYFIFLTGGYSTKLIIHKAIKMSEPLECGHFLYHFTGILSVHTFWIK